MGKPYSVRHKHWKLALFLCQLSTVERNTCTRLLLFVSYWQVYRLVRGGNHHIDAWHTLWILEIKIDRRHRKETAFSSHHGLLRFTKCPFGLSNAPTRFKESWTLVFRPSNESLLFCTRTTLCFCKSFREHMLHPWQVPTLLADSDIPRKLKKCSFLAERIDYLRNAFRPYRLGIAHTTTSAIRQFKDPARQT